METVEKDRGRLEIRRWTIGSRQVPLLHLGLPPKAGPLLKARRHRASKMPTTESWLSPLARMTAIFARIWIVHNMTILKHCAHNLLRQDQSLKVDMVNKRRSTWEASACLTT